jgi:hypothetical protein
LILEDEAVTEESQKLHFIPYCQKPTKCSKKKHDTTDHKSHFLSGANCYMFRYQCAIITQFINSEISYVQRPDCHNQICKPQTVQTPDCTPIAQVHTAAAAATPHSDRPPLSYIRSTLCFLSRAHKHPYQYLIQRDLLRRKLTTYPVPGYKVRCNTLYTLPVLSQGLVPAILVFTSRSKTC